jgi:hypothetical protein|uniref:DUF3105 domain-containing protein n=1 Tax=Candidatus Nanopelagicus sp. TaxID=2518620 RepID=UPI004049B9E3
MSSKKNMGKPMPDSSDRQSKLYIYGTGLVLILALIGATTFSIINSNNQESALNLAASKPIAGVESFTELSRNHITTALAPITLPPTGGDHAANWTECGIYTSPVDTSMSVHSLEHGAAWISYQTTLPKDQIKTLESFVTPSSYRLIAPYDNLASPIVLSSWGKQLSVDNASDARIAVFLKAFTQGPDTPEPGAPC